MARRGDPKVLRLVVIFLRDLARRSQEAFGVECGLSQSQVSLYESGNVAPSEEVLRRMAKVAGLEWPLVLQLRQFYASLLAAAARGPSAAPGKALDLSILEPVLLAVTPYLIEAHAAEPARPAAEEELREARKIWSALEKHPIPFRRRLVELSPRSGSWALAVEVCEASIRRAAHNAAEALELAELALAMAERAPGEPSWRSRLKGYCWAHVANARRVAVDLRGADEAFTRARQFWQSGSEPAPGRLAEWLLPAMEASLRRAQRRFPEALELLGRARVGCAGDPRAIGRILLNRESVLNQQGDIQAAFDTLLEAAPFVEASGEAHLLFALRFNMADNLCHLERHAEAGELLPRVRELAVALGNELDLLRIGWLEGKIAAGQGRPEEAVACLNQLKEAFLDRDMPYDAALSSLDLAVLLLKAGRTAEVKELAVSMGRIFQAKGISREALASLKLFCDAARQERATVELARQVMEEVARAGLGASSS